MNITVQKPLVEPKKLNQYTLKVGDTYLSEDKKMLAIVAPSCWLVVLSVISGMIVPYANCSSDPTVAAHKWFPCEIDVAVKQ